MAAMMEPSWPGKSTPARVRAPRQPATSARRSSHYARAAHRQQAEMQLCILGRAGAFLQWQIITIAPAACDMA